MANKKSNKGNGYYAVYKQRDVFSKNKLRKLESHVKKFPNDEQAASELANLKAEYKNDHGIKWRRGTPSNRGGWLKLTRFPKSVQKTLEGLSPRQTKKFVELYQRLTHTKPLTIKKVKAYAG